MKAIEKTQFISLNQQRDIRLPFQLSVVGTVKTPSLETYKIYGRSELEFCLRLRSAEEEAVDLIDGKTYRYRFPHLIIKRPDVSHEYTVHSAREAIFLIYSPTLEDV
ncbi:MAG: hypothetical protein ACQKBW_02280, partial [Puniceicoccales bacterium]